MENFVLHTKAMTTKDWLIDALVACAAFAFGCLELNLAANQLLPDEMLRRLLGIESVAPSLGAYVALAFTTLPLVARRRAPWPVFIFVLIAFVGFHYSLRSISLSLAGPLVALFTIASECSLAEAAVSLCLALFGLLIVPQTDDTAASVWMLSFIQDALFLVAALLVGYAFRAHRAYVQATEERAQAAERTREEEAARRVEAERVRIAREVHDIVAHSLSAVSIQLSAAERVIEHDPAAAKEVIGTTRRVAKDALDEIRGMIGVLRAEDSAAEMAPTEGTEALLSLVEYLKGACVTAQLDTARYERTLVPTYVDVALFNIAREASTNIVRHAHAHQAWIQLYTDGAAACLVVDDDGSGEGASVEERGAGHGIQGMRERAKLLGGTLDVGRRSEGGWRVWARIPLSVSGGNEGV